MEMLSSRSCSCGRGKKRAGGQSSSSATSVIFDILSLSPAPPLPRSARIPCRSTSTCRPTCHCQGMTSNPIVPHPPSPPRRRNRRRRRRTGCSTCRPRARRNRRLWCHHPHLTIANAQLRCDSGRGGGSTMRGCHCNCSPPPPSSSFIPRSPPICRCPCHPSPLPPPGGRDRICRIMMLWWQSSILS